MQDNNHERPNMSRSNGSGSSRNVRRPAGDGQPRRTRPQTSGDTRQRTSTQRIGQPGKPRSVQSGPGQQAVRPQSPKRRSSGTKRTSSGKQSGGKKRQNLTPQQAARKKRNKIILFIAEIFVLLMLVVVFWGIVQARKVKFVKFEEGDVEINEEVKKDIESGGVMQGYRNIALFGVDSRSGELDKGTRTDTIMIASINLDTKEVRIVSVYRDTWLNMSTDSYSKANAAYARGGPKQAINMLNMNLDMDITDFVTVGFDALIDVIDAVGGVEIDIKEAEMEYLNSYQVSISGKQDGTLNAAGEPNYVPDPSNPYYKDYKPITTPGVQNLNGLQATAYCRIRYVGNDYERTQRQRTVLQKVAQKAMSLNPVTLNKIAEAVFPKIATSLDLSEILSLLSGIASYEIGESSAFPFEGYVNMAGRVGKASVVIPLDLEQNVILLHQFFFEADTEYSPSETVKRCSQKIASDTGTSASQ